MSIVILGGNECMERRYMDLCQSYRCRAKVFIKPVGGLKNKLGDPDLTIFFTSTMSHKMVQSALRELKSCDTVIERCHTSSLSALRNILEKHAGYSGRDQDRQPVLLSLRLPGGAAAGGAPHQPSAGGQGPVSAAPSL